MGLMIACRGQVMTTDLSVLSVMTSKYAVPLLLSIAAQVDCSHMSQSSDGVL